MLLNDGTYNGKKILSPASVKTMLSREWIYDTSTRDGYIYIMNGEAVEEDEDTRSAGKFSNNYIWPETVGNAICHNVFVR